jgi:HAMP domain-containing protein
MFAVILTVMFATVFATVFALGFWIGRDTRSRHEFVRLAASRNPYTPPRDGSTNDIEGKPE